jgi:DUF1680 family protein
VTLIQETDYPWNGKVRIQIEDCSSGAFGLKLRIPGWTRNASIRINDKIAEARALPATYVELRRDWQKGDVVDLNLPMPSQLIEANPLVEETLNQVAAKRGPIVYCLESADLPSDTRIQDVSVPANMDLVARYDRRLLGGVVVLEGLGLIRPEEDWRGQLYRALQVTRGKPAKLRLVPYFAWGNRGAGDMSVWLPLSAN